MSPEAQTIIRTFRRHPDDWTFEKGRVVHESGVVINHVGYITIAMRGSNSGMYSWTPSLLDRYCIWQAIKRRVRSEEADLTKSFRAELIRRLEGR